MNFKLNSNNDGKVRYYLRQKNGQTVGSDTKLESAYWILKQGQPEKSEEFKGFPISVKTKDGDEYFFSGEWLMGGEKDVLGDEPEQSTSCGPDYCEVEEPQKPARKRRVKDVVLELM